MRLIGKPAGDCDLRQRFIRRDDFSPGAPRSSLAPEEGGIDAVEAAEPAREPLARIAIEIGPSAYCQARIFSQRIGQPIGGIAPFLRHCDERFDDQLLRLAKIARRCTNQEVGIDQACQAGPASPVERQWNVQHGGLRPIDEVPMRREGWMQQDIASSDFEATLIAGFLIATLENEGGVRMRMIMPLDFRRSQTRR